MSKQLCLPRRKSLGDLSSTDLKLDLESDSGVSVNEQKAIESIHGEFDSKITSKDKQIEELQKEILSLKEFSENQELIRQQEQATIMAENFQLKQLIRKQKTTIIKGAKCIEFLKREIEKTKNHEKEYQRKVEEMENEVEKSKELIENMTEQSAEFVEENKHVILDKMFATMEKTKLRMAEEFARTSPHSDNESVTSDAMKQYCDSKAKIEEQIKEANDQIESLDKELKNRLTEVKGRLTCGVKHQLETSRMTIQSLTKYSLGLTETIKRSFAYLKALKNDNEDLFNANQEMSKNMNEKNSKINLLNNENKELRDENTGLLNTVNHKDSVIQELNDEIMRLTQLFIDKKARSRRLKCW